MVENIELSDKSLKKLAELINNGNPLSDAAQIILAIVPIVGILFGAFLFFSLFYFYHKQKLLLIEKEHYQPFQFNWNMIFIVGGAIMTFIGIVMVVVFVLSGAIRYELLGAGIPLAIGLALIVSYLVSNRVRGGR